MKKEVKRLIEKIDATIKKHDTLLNEIIDNESLPKELRDEMVKIKEVIHQQKIDDDKYIEANKHRKIIGYDDNFMPIYKDKD